MPCDFYTLRELFKVYKELEGQEVLVRGWAKTIRDQKSFAFINLSDGTQFKTLQLVVSSDKFGENQELIRQGTSTAYEASGIVRLTPGSKQDFELEVTNLKVLGSCPPEYPLQPKRHSPEFLRTIPHLRPRTNLFQAAFRIRSEAAFAIHEFFHSRGFVYVHTPIITSDDAEGAGQMFNVSSLPLESLPLKDDGSVDFSQDFFSKACMLTVTGQLHVEAFAQAFTNVYTFGPTFRAEHSNTPRHAAEFWMIEPEISFADLNDDMNLAEDMLSFVLNRVLERCATELEFLNQFVDKNLLDRLQKQAKSNFARISYTDAIKELEKNNGQFKYPVTWGADIQTEHEKFLTDKVFNGPVFVHDYPADIKAFYMRINEDGKTVAAMDGLVPGIGELIGGSQREERIDKLIEMIERKGLKLEDYSWYVDLRRFGTSKHAGFGLGFERLIMYLTGINNIRDVLPYPRTTGQAMF